MGPRNTDAVYVFKGSRSPSYLNIPVSCILLGPVPEIPKAIWTTELLYLRVKPNLLNLEAGFAEKLTLGLFTYLAVHQRHTSHSIVDSLTCII